jgi:hypothetical protein
MSTQLRRITLVGVLLGCLALFFIGNAAAVGINQGASCTNNSSFVKDVTFPDNTQIDPGKSFTKVWRIRNSGTCTWTTDYSIVHYGFNRMGAPAKIKLKERVPPGSNVDISVRLTAPTTAGTHRSTWQLQSPSGVNFGIRPYAQIVVVDPLSLLKKEVYFGGFGGYLTYCDVPFNGPLFETKPEFLFNTLHLTFRKVPLAPAIDVAIRSPNGRAYSTTFNLDKVYSCSSASKQEYIYDGENGGFLSGTSDGSQHAMGVNIFIPAGSPTGQWSVTVNSGDVQVRRDFTVRANPDPDIAVMAANRLYDPFNEVYCDSITVGRAIKIVGEGFPKSKGIPIGMYREGTTEYSPLTAGIVVQTDSQGRFSTTFTPDNRFRRGSAYHLRVPGEAIYTGSGSAEEYVIGIGELCFKIQ